MNDENKTIKDFGRQLLNEMRLAGERKEQARSHDSPERCARCGYRSTCDQALH